MPQSMILNLTVLRCFFWDIIICVEDSVYMGLLSAFATENSHLVSTLAHECISKASIPVLLIVKGQLQGSKPEAAKYSLACSALQSSGTLQD